MSKPSGSRAAGAAPERGAPLSSCALYVISPATVDREAFPTVLAAALDAGPVAAFQIRLKGIADDEIRRTVDVLRPIAQDRDVAVILNDRPDLAAELGCDGVHIGQDDAAYADARRLVGDDAIVGVTCHDSRHLALEAAEAGADYVAFGAFFPTVTKAAATVASTDLLAWWSETTVVPCVAIGGITPANCPPLIAAGADFLAVSNAVWSDPEGPAAAIRAFHQAIAAHSRAGS